MPRDLWEQWRKALRAMYEADQGKLGKALNGMTPKELEDLSRSAQDLASSVRGYLQQRPDLRVRTGGEDA